jgi:hypothetical protein
MLAQRASAIRTLTSPNPGMDDSPTKNVATMITRHDNLLALVKEANLVERHRLTRPPFLKMRDRLYAKVLGAPSDEDMQVALAQTLETRLNVEATDDTNLAITVEWSNPQLAYDLVTLVQKNFLEARYDSDVAVITESIEVLEEHAKSELSHVDSELEDYQKVLGDYDRQKAASQAATLTPTRPRYRVVTSGGAPRAVPTGPVVPEQDPGVAKQLEDTRARIRALEASQQKDIDDARQRLTQAQLTLTPMHPTVITLQQQLDAISQPSPALTELRDQERALMVQIAPPRPIAIASASAPAPFAGFRQSLVPIASDSAAASSSATAAALALFDDRDNGRLQLSQSKLALAIHAYEDAMDRIDRAKTELDVTRAAYKYRYTVVKPAEVPRHPKKATANMVAAGAVIGGALLALLLAAAADLAGGTVLESWQVRRRLKIDVIGELDIPS